MPGALAFHESIELGGRTISLNDVFSPAHIKFVLGEDRPGTLRLIETIETQGTSQLDDSLWPLDLGPTEDASRHIRVLFARKHQNALHKGLMWRLEDRDALAIFTDRTADDVETFRALLHELTHCLHLHHNDYEGSRYKVGSTIEGASPSATVKWALSGASRQHLLQDPALEIWPGGLGFYQLTEEHLRRHQPQPSQETSLYRLSNAQPSTTPGSGFSKYQPSSVGLGLALAAEKPSLDVSLETQRHRVLTHEPLLLTIGIHNRSDHAQSVLPLIDPNFGYLEIEVKRPMAAEFTRFRPAMLADAGDVAPIALAPNASLHEEVPIFFGSDGWTFDEPGEYQLRARYSPSDLDDRVDSSIESEAIRLTVSGPTTACDAEFGNAFSESSGALFLLYRGGARFQDAHKRLREAVVECPRSPYAPYAKLALGVAAVREAQQMAAIESSREHLAVASRYLRSLYEEGLPPRSVAVAIDELARGLERIGNIKESTLLRGEVRQHLDGEESAADLFPALRSTGSEIFVPRHWSRNPYPRSLAVGSKHYFAVSGDTFWTIARRFRSGSLSWQELTALPGNRYINDPNLIFPGDPILLE
jgi:hypothetical protein